MLQLISALDVSYNAVLDYYNAFKDRKLELNSFAIILINEGYAKYIEWIEKYEVNYKKRMFFLINNEEPDYLIGFGSIEHSNIQKHHSPTLNSGAIGYGVRPCDRLKGYGNVILTLLIEKCIGLGLPEVCISCWEDNIGSKKIIENHEAILESRFFDNSRGKYGLKYWIKTEAPVKTKTIK